jgi:type I restriction enzyme R subunit
MNGASDCMDKTRHSESNICDKFIRPAMETAGWNGMDQIYREYPLRAGRVVVRGKQAQRDKRTAPGFSTSGWFRFSRGL